MITTPEGVSHQLELDSRIPIWPLRRARVLACANAEDEAEQPAQLTPVVPEPPINRGEESPPRPKSGEQALPPPEHYLTHEPKHPGCEICQEAKLTGRKCIKMADDPDKRKPDSLVAKAEKFGDLSTADHLNTHGQEGIEGADHAVVFKEVGTG